MYAALDLTSLSSSVGVVLDDALDNTDVEHTCPKAYWVTQMLSVPDVRSARLD